jgi:uncharacterized protein with PQ loop repeat
MNKKRFERFMLVFATVEPIATIPQIIEVWKPGGTRGVSLVTWLFYTLTSVVWLIYGILQKDKPLIISGVLWVASQGLVVAGVLLHA